MPKKIDPELKAGAVRLVNDHLPEYPSMTAACEAVAKQVGVGTESPLGGPGWSTPGRRAGLTSEEHEEIKRLKSKVRRLEEDNEILRRASIFFAGELDPRNR